MSGASLVAQTVKRLSACKAGDPGSIPGLGRSLGEGNGKPTPVFLTGKSYGERSLVGCSPWGHKELDTAERLYKANWQGSGASEAVFLTLGSSLVHPDTL